MKVRELIELLSTVPGERVVKIATQNPKYPNDIGMDHTWLLNKNKNLKAGTKFVMLVAKRRSAKELKLMRKLDL